VKSNSNVFDLPVFDPGKDWITLKQNHANDDFN